MRKTLVPVLLLLLTVFSANPALSNNCPQPPQSTDSWTVVWTDSYNQTTYSLTAPCKVYIGIPFNITATVTDSVYRQREVGFAWSIIDNGSVILGGGWNTLDVDVNGQWQRVISRTYTGDPIDHILEFRFTDEGQGSGSHWWRSNLIGHLTVDPFPPGYGNKAPVANAGPDTVISSENQNTTVITGIATDEDNDSLTYRWLEGETVLSNSSIVNNDGTAPLFLDAIPPFSRGSHTLTLEVSDGTETVTDKMALSIENSPPTVAASAGGTFQLFEPIALNGSVADYDGDAITYEWLEAANALASGTVYAVYGGSPVMLPTHVLSGLPLGAHELTLKVSDGVHTVSAGASVNVVDTIAPTLAPAASSTILWPPDNRMVNVTITANARDNSGSPVLLKVSVTGSETQGTEPDYMISAIDQQTGTVYLQLRAQRPGNSAERSYTVTLTAEDESGNFSSADIIIKAPHDRRRQ